MNNRHTIEAITTYRRLNTTTNDPLSLSGAINTPQLFSLSVFTHRGTHKPRKISDLMQVTFTTTKRAALSVSLSHRNYFSGDFVQPTPQRSQVKVHLQSSFSDL